MAQLTAGEPAGQKQVVITIDDRGNVRVVHEITKSESVKQVNLVKGTALNLKVVDVQGNDVQYGTIGLKEISIITIFPTDKNVIVVYNLVDALFLEGDMWTWNYAYPVSSTFIFPDKVDLVYVNSNPVKLDGAKIRCHGCNALIEFVIDEPIYVEQVQWEDEKFTVGIRTVTEITSFRFDQPTKSIAFKVKENNQLITLFIPLELLWNPYEVFVGDQKILKREFFSNETHVWLNIRPETAGTVQIIGSSVIPEFPLFAPLFLGIIVVIILQFRNKINLRQSHKNKTHIRLSVHGR